LGFDRKTGQERKQPARLNTDVPRVRKIDCVPRKTLNPAKAPKPPTLMGEVGETVAKGTC